MGSVDERKIKMELTEIQAKLVSSVRVVEFPAELNEAQLEDLIERDSIEGYGCFTILKFGVIVPNDCTSPAERVDNWYKHLYESVTLEEDGEED